MTTSAAWAEVRDAVRLARSPNDASDVAPGALAWLPLAGGVLGICAALAAVLVGRWSPVLGGAVALGVLRALEASPATRLGLGLLAIEAVALARAPVGTQALALVLAPTLGAWSRVVQCHGGGPVQRDAPAGLVGRATFREFGVASVLAIGGALAVFDALGLLAVLGAVIPTILLRAVIHRRQGGMPPWGPAVSGRVAEAVVIVVLAALSPP